MRKRVSYLVRDKMFLPRRKPRKTAIIPSMLLASRLIRANLYSPERIRSIVSRVKEEKVVNPPKRPVKRKARVLWEKEKASAILQQKPIRKEPITLTDKIPKGKG